MKGKVRNFLAVLGAAAMLLASCGSANTPTAATTPATQAPTKTGAPSGVPMSTQTVAQTPKYGGTLTVWHGASDPSGFDPYKVMDLLCTSIFLSNDELLQGDWTKGPAGSKEIDWLLGNEGRVDVLAGALAESWDVPDNQTITFHIRKGVRWVNKEPANGREFTAEDAAWNMNKMWEFPMSTHYSGTPPEQRLISAKALDKYTFQLKVPPDTIGLHLIMDGERCHMMCPDVVQKYGDLTDWKKSIGTGPFMLTDFVSGSSLTYVRNPNHWRTDPIGSGKGNQLPYLDGIKALIIADASTRLAAFRTGKVDMNNALWEDANELTRANPKLEKQQTFAMAYFPTARQDKPELPFDDVKVRQAMNLAVNKVDIAKSYYQGNAEVMGWPFYPCATHKYLYTPLDQMPADVQEIVKGGNADKAKQLLKDAGYPNGFKTNIVCTSDQVDLLSIVREQLLSVNIDMEIRVLEAGVFRSVNRGRSHEQMIMKEPKMAANVFRMHEVRKESFDNLSFYDNPKMRAVYNEMNKYLGRDDMKWQAMIKAEVPFMIQECVMGIWLPVPYAYNMWQPWIKNYYGCSDIGFFTPTEAAWYAWIDQDLKKSMGH